MSSLIQAAGWPIWPLILCSVLALAFIIERLFQLREHKVIPPRTLELAVEMSGHGHAPEETILMLEKNGVLGPVLASGLRCLRNNPAARYLTALGTIASAAPLLGLLGTVIGMIEIFAAQTAGSSQPAQLAYGISVALYNTAFGLVVAIPSLMFWRYFRTRVDNMLLSMEVASEQFARHLTQLRH